jgi:FtsP/CotA-like multicopper oxidase with cupredoxin domain
MNETARNNWHGLQGFFLVTDHRERSLPLPRGKYDVPLMVADRSLTPSNQLTNPFAGRTHSMTGMTGPHAPPGDGTVGSRILVDGRFAPHLGVSARRYRLRLLNTSDFQSYDFALTDGRPFIQVGNGSGLLPHPDIRQNILLGPAQRADVVVDFGGELHQRIELESIARPHRPPSGVGTPPAQIMQFRVNTTAPDHSRVPANLEQPPPIHASKKPSYTWTVGLGGDAATGTYWTINGQPFNPHRVDVEVPLGATRTWRLRNMSPITHYIHLHEEQWHTLLRDGKKPPPWERGLEDTWRLDPGESVVVAAKFTDYTGVFMLHCHMLDHEDDGMMAQFAVVDRHTRALPRGYHLPRQSSGSHVAVMSGMDMSGGGPGFVASLTGWQRNLAEGLEALLIELCAVGLFIGLRRVWRIS